MEGQVQIPDEILYYISCFHETDHSKDMRGEGGWGGGGEGIKLCADSVGWNW